MAELQRKDINQNYNFLLTQTANKRVSEQRKARNLLFESIVLLFVGCEYQAGELDQVTNFSTQIKDTNPNYTLNNNPRQMR